MPGKALVPLTPAPPPEPPAGVPWPPQRERDSAAAIVTIARWARRNRHYTVPVAVPVVLWVAGLVFYRTYAAGYVAGGGLILAGCVCYFAGAKWDRPAERWYARLSVIAAWLWLTAASVAGPLTGPVTAIVLGSVLVAAGVAWGFFWWRHKRPRGQRQRDRLTAQCDAWWQSHCFAWNLHGSQVIDAALSGVTLRMRVQLRGGRQTYEHCRAQTALIESAAEGQADIGYVRVEKVKGHPSQVDIFLKRDNPLRGTVTYDPDIAPASVHDPAPFGRKETGEWKMGDLRKNRFTIGRTRSGKSNDELVALANLSGCPDALAVVIDLKGGRSARPVLKAAAAEHVIVGVDEARMWLRFCVAEIKARATWADPSSEQLRATPEVPAVFTMVDETYGLTATEDGAGDPECRRHMGTGASQGSGLEFYYYVYTQNGALDTSVGSEQIRANLPHRTCYATSEARHGAYVIPEYARLDASRLEEKGTCYDKDGPDVTPEQIRAPHMPHGLFVTIAGQNAALMDPPRPPLRLYCGEDVAYEVVTGRDEDGQETRRGVTWQEWWDQRWLRLPEPFRADSPQYQAAAAANGVAAGATEACPACGHKAHPETPMECQWCPEGYCERPAPPPAQTPAVSADDLMARVPDGFRPDPALVKALPRVMAAQREKFCHLLEAATPDSAVTPTDLAGRSGMSRSWVSDRLRGLAELGLITTASRGRYHATPGADIAAGLAEIRRRADRLADDARQLIDAQ